MKNEEEILKEKARKVSIFEGCAYSLMDGFGLRFITPFAVELKSSNAIIGLLGSLPSLIGNFSQMITLKSIGKYSRKKIVFFSVLSQAIMWLPLIAVAIFYFNGKIGALNSSLLLLMIYCLISFFGALGGPAWGSWMGDIVTKKGSYFGRRSTIIGIVGLGALFCAGMILDFFRINNEIFIGFIILFFVAFLGRAVSAYFFTKQYEPKFVREESKYFSFFQFVKKMHHNNFGRFVIYISLMGFSVAIASPFFAVFMLRDLGFENFYVPYTIVTMSSIIISLLVMPLWGKFIDKFGPAKVLKTNGFFLCLTPFLWFVSSFFAGENIYIITLYLIVAESISGFVWAGFNLATSVFIYDAVTRQRLALCIAYQGIISAVLGFIGATIGGQISHIKFGEINSLLVVFIISGVLRLTVAIFGRSLFAETKEVERFKMIYITRKIRGILKTGIRRLGFENEIREG